MCCVCRGCAWHFGGKTIWHTDGKSIGFCVIDKGIVNKTDLIMMNVNFL